MRVKGKIGTLPASRPGALIAPCGWDRNVELLDFQEFIAYPCLAGAATTCARKSIWKVLSNNVT